MSKKAQEIILDDEGASNPLVHYLIGWSLSTILFVFFLYMFFDVDLSHLTSSKDLIVLLEALLASIVALVFKVVTSHPERYSPRRDEETEKDEIISVPRPPYLLPESIRSVLLALIYFIVVDTLALVFLLDNRFARTLRTQGFQHGLYWHIAMFLVLFTLNCFLFVGERTRVRLALPGIIAVFYVMPVLILVTVIKAMLRRPFHGPQSRHHNPPSHVQDSKSLARSGEELALRAGPQVERSGHASFLSSHPSSFDRALTSRIQDLVLIFGTMFLSVLATLVLLAIPFKALVSLTLYPGSTDYVRLSKPIMVTLWILSFHVQPITVISLLADTMLILALILGIGVFMLYIDDDPELSHYFQEEHAILERHVLELYQSGMLPEPLFREELRKIHEVALMRAKKGYDTPELHSWMACRNDLKGKPPLTAGSPTTLVFHPRMS